MSYQVQVQARPVPAITATVLITLFFGFFGLIPTTIHTNRARDAGQQTNKYWKAFGLTFGILLTLGLLLYVL